VQASTQEVAESTVVLPPHGACAVPGSCSCREAKRARRRRRTSRDERDDDGAPVADQLLYGRALQDEALKAWKGQSQNVGAGQKAFFNRSKLVSAARSGRYAEKMGASSSRRETSGRSRDRSRGRMAKAHAVVRADRTVDSFYCATRRASRACPTRPTRRAVANASRAVPNASRAVANVAGRCECVASRCERVASSCKRGLPDQCPFKFECSRRETSLARRRIRRFSGLREGVPQS
jgi:hypothetical protein